MGGTKLAKARILELKKKISHAQEKKKEFSVYLNDLKHKYHKGEISYSIFLETFYQKRNGLNIKEWIEHLDEHVKQCKKEIAKEKKVILKTQFIFAFFSAILISIIAFPLFYLQPKFLGFAIQEEENLTIGNITEIVNGSYSEETGELNETFPEQEPLPISENISAERNVSGISEEQELNVPEENTTEIPEEIINETEQIPEENISEEEKNITEISEIKEKIIIPEEEEEFEDENLAVETIQHPAVLGEKVKWTKKVVAKNEINLTLEIPDEAENIKVKKIEDEKQEDVIGQSTITGAIISERNQGNFLSRLLSKILGAITGRVVATPNIEVNLEINSGEEYEIEYFTDAPTSSEEEIEKGKRVIISSPDTIHYENVLAFTNLNENLKIKNPSSIKIKWVEQNIFLPFEKIEDLDSDGFYDYISWIAPSLSEQTFEIILISKAEHLDSNRDFISDIYEQVKALDDVWSETINENEYVRVTFEIPLDNSRDITLYPRIVSGNPRVEIYEKDGNDLIAEFFSLNENEYNKIFLTNLISESQDVFDLKILGGSLEFEHIVDPQKILYAGPSSNIAYNGTLNDNTLLVNIMNKMNVNDYSKINATNGLPIFIPPGCSASADCFVSVNYTNIPAGYTAINISTVHNLSITSSARTGIALWNFTIGTWSSVLNTSSTAALTMKSYNITPASLVDFVSGSELRVMIFDDSGSASILGVDSILINVTYAADTTKPAISILFPTNLTNTSNILLNVNATYSDAGGISEVWYNNDTHSTLNKSLGKTPTFYNITNITWSEGIHNVTIYVNDSAGNENWTSVTFMIDSVKPAVAIQFPTVNNTNSSSLSYNVNFTFSDLNGITNTWYANDTYSVANKSLGGGGTFYNITNITWSQGKHNVTVYVNDSFGNVNFSTISFTIDSVNPSLTILVPSVNQTNTTNIVQNINFTFFDVTGIAEAWYNNDTTSVANKSLGKDGTFYNITNLTWSEGKHNVTIYVNDSAGNINYTSFSFTVDTVIPGISIAFPTQNNTNNTNTLDVNFTASDSGSGLYNFWYNNDSYNIANKSLGVLGTSFNITNITWSDALHNVTIWANDSAGNYNFATISFRIDSVNPSLTILVPSVNQTNTTNIAQNINFTFFDLTGIDSVWYNNDTTSVANKSLGIGGNYFNITNLTWAEGKHNVTIYVNDSAGNLNYTSFSFTIDLTKPDINITYPFNNTVVSDVNADVNYTRSDSVGLFNCWYSNDTYLVNTTLASCENITTITWGAGAHNVTVWANDSAGNWNRSTINFSILANTPPKIRNVYNDTASIIALASGLNSGPLNTSVIINFSVYDAQGVANMNNATATINFSKSGEALRQNNTCTQFEVGTNVANYTCNITMMWFDGAGAWAINAFISDNDGNDAKNNSANFSVGETVGFEVGSLSWAALVPGSTNQSATAALRLNNTGNKNMTANTTQINATDLRGEVTPTTWIFGGNVSVSWNATSPAACEWSNSSDANFGVAANKLKNNTFINITVANLSKGYYPTNDGFTGQEDFYFCIRTVGSELTGQQYSTLAYGPWQIQILLTLVAIPNRRKKRANAEASSFGRKKKKSEKDKLIDALDLSEYLQISDKLKDEFELSREEIIRTIIEKTGKKYGVDRKELLEIIKAREGISIPLGIFSKEIGALESLVKYMKENLEMTYKEISKELGRDERTVWTSYKKATEKQSEKIEIKKTDLILPMSIFENKNLTILESLVIYLKEKGMKYSEIGELLNRDQRNIWTIYNRAIKKKR